MEYWSVHEAAAKWGVSERRIHKLCKDGRIDGIIRFGRSWGIPQDAKKPEDGRRTGEAPAMKDVTEIFGRADFFGPDARLLTRNETCAVFQLENDTGNGVVTIYDVFPGVQLMYCDLHLYHIAGHDIRGHEDFADAGRDILVIEHCREGRFECEFPWGECAYMGEGDLAVSKLPMPVKSSVFPLSHYHGISIMADTELAAKTIGDISSMLGMAHIHLAEIGQRLMEKQPWFLLRGSEEVSHIFSELYQAPDPLKESYIRLKIIELLLFLSIAKPTEETRRQYFYKKRVQAVKAMRDDMTAHLEKQYTLDELSARWDIPLTAMKCCFKSIFGMPIHAYMRAYRMQAASALLKETDEPVAEIAARVGYDSHTQFSSAFKSVTGMSPSDYRKVSV